MVIVMFIIKDNNFLCNLSVALKISQKVVALSHSLGVYDLLSVDIKFMHSLAGFVPMFPIIDR